MQVIPRCRCLLIPRNSINFPTIQFASLHSTPVFNDKRKNKFKSDFKESQQPSKNYARYVIRQKRAYDKAALAGVLYEYGDSPKKLQSDQRFSKWCGSTNGNPPNSSKKKGGSKRNSCRAEKIHNHRMRRKLRKGYLSDDDDEYPETPFEASFGKRRYTWSFNSHKSNPGFKWRESFHRTSDYQKEWGTSNEPKSDYGDFNVGSHLDRAILGLPQRGPLELKDVKKAFHLSALKWHPDKHQGTVAQEAAEEKFRLCMTAYNSLCTALSGT